MKVRHVLASFAMFAIAGTAHANSRLPQANQLVFAADDPTSMLLRTTFGLLFSHDSGKTWDWLCEDAIPVSGQQDPAVALLNGGVVVSAQEEGLATSPDRGCSWSFVSGTAKELAVDVARTTDGASAIALTNVLEPSTDASALVYQSTMLHTSDSAKTWQTLSGAIDSTLEINTIDLAPSDPNRIYVTGEVFGASQATMLVSSDGGQSYQPFPIPFVAGETGAYIAAVDPQNENLVYVRTLGAVKNTGQSVSRFLVSSDGGQTYTEHWSGDAMLGFALSQDGSRVYLGSIGDGMFAANASDLTFSKISALEIQCLATRGNVLYACSNETSSLAVAGNKFILASTTDEGATFTPMLALETIAAPIACAAGTSAAICGSEWLALTNQLHIDAGSVTDAGTDAAPPSSNCGCEASSSSSESAIFFGALLMLFVASRPRKRGRRIRLRSRLSRAAR